ncbi:MBL fold metallo-hydrolase [Clostridium sp. AM58-1XD]|uniref:MBL fold metallo-hydrolase n=1 Tax=Clostridium sp. AM58-1XD TaxID=2292307 RepID=UPI000E4A8F8F|nr:MBL fold metallo-hydrolase [Clostridium sp. AM58-1XD]RGY99901.1 MBL fold metallo-hydrolase [Clostridium sp. AM58-1XD]
MRYQVNVLFPGFSGRLKNGRLNWGTVALIQGCGHNILMDCGGMVIRSNLKEMLAEYHLKCEDIDVILLSHMHADHVYNIDYFPQAEIFLSKAEWEHAYDMIHRDYSVGENAVCLLRSYHLNLIEREGEEIAPGIRTLMTPGHTPGCMSYVLDQEERGIWILTGDAVKNRYELSNETVQQTLCKKDSISSIRVIKKLADRVLPGHDCWLTVKDGNVIAEGGNDIVFQFGQGGRVNGKTSIIFAME